jgi:hypothetical protein
MRSYLNLDGGLRFHHARTNVDFVAGDPSVVAHDLRKGVPFGDEQSWRDNYDWMMLELYDQTVRERSGGEVHLWMYDRHSLARALRGAGFRDPRVVGAAESRIPGWAGFHLDTEPDGSVYKPDSLYMEASK